MWSGNRECEIAEGDDGHISIAEIEAINACNHVAVGVFWRGGVEYAFEVESGNNAGFVWRSISQDGPIPEIQITHTKWALAPRADVVEKHVQKGSQTQLLTLWDVFLERPDVAAILTKYAYDRHFQPGSKVESYWRGQADNVGMVLVPQEEADSVRALIAQGGDE